jgi:magnesium-protoporphyrin IX monomethyl ester (oxidative) cyclase
MFPPTGLEYVAASAKGFAEKLTLLDLRYADNLSEAQALLDFIAREVDILCVGIGWDRQLDEICAFLDRVPGDVAVVAGGYTATEKTEELFQKCRRMDIVVRGEGEETIRDILKGLPRQEILGISFRVNGEVKHNPNRPFPDVNNIPAPDRSLRRSCYRLSVNGVDLAGLSFDAVLSARGCPFNCKFCTFSLNPLGQKRDYAARDARSVVDEIATVDAGIVLFSDENFSVDPRRSEEICDLIISRGIKKRFAAQVRLDIASYPRLLEKMVAAGFKALLIGIESPHDRILKQLNKGFNAQQVRDAFCVLRRYPIFYHGYFIYGNIGESEEEMLRIPQFAREIGVDSITTLKLRIEKFSPLRQLAESTPGCHITEKGELYSDTYSHAALKKIGRKIKFSFYTPARYVKILAKGIRIHFFTVKELALLFLALPALVRTFVIRDIQKGRLGDSLLRTINPQAK